MIVVFDCDSYHNKKTERLPWSSLSRRPPWSSPSRQRTRESNTFFVRCVSALIERHCRLVVAGAMPNRIWRIRNLRRRLRILRRRLRILRRIRILRRARQARNELWFDLSQANAMVEDLIMERIRFRHTAALRASTQLRFVVRGWGQQVTQNLDYALRRLARARELADRAHEEKVKALLHLEEISWPRDDFNPT